ncbi:hypothetical protein TNCV_4696991 [Trichonephila clavipes]|nr:hypothetical protein TNCV_4696991 [Trichonephila clavipes]
MPQRRPERGVPAQVSSSSLDHGSKRRDLSPSLSFIVRFTPLKTRRVDVLMRFKSVKAQNTPVAMMGKFGEEVLATRGLLATDHVILNHGQVTWTTPELECKYWKLSLSPDKKTGSVENKPRPGGPSKLISRAKRMIVRLATNKPMTSAQNIANELLSSCNVSVSAQTVRNVLHSTGLKARELPERNLILVK